jgi:uncharacterized protein YaaN involved in tellurite resistance
MVCIEMNQSLMNFGTIHLESLVSSSVNVLGEVKNNKRVEKVRGKSLSKNHSCLRGLTLQS